MSDKLDIKLNVEFNEYEEFQKLIRAIVRDEISKLNIEKNLEIASELKDLAISYRGND